MKKIFTISFLFAGLIAVSQNYQLFNVNSKKVYKTDSSDKTYSLAFDSVIVNNSLTTLYPIRDFGYYSFPTGDCPMMGPCFRRSAPIWIGISVEQIADGIYNFVNSDFEILNFNFNIKPNVLHVFYEDDVQRFSYQYNPTIKTYTIDGVIDSVKVFNILHTTLSGNVIMSELHGREIIVGKELGLINFFVVNEFPESLIPLSLIGTNSPDVGLIKISYADMYNYHPGDEIQYIESSTWGNGPPSLNYTRYKKQTYLERSETDEFVYYRVATEVFYVDSLEVTKDTIDLSYGKNAMIAEIPFEFGTGDYMNNKNLKMVNHFGVNHWLYSEDNYFLELNYCSDSNFWCKAEDMLEYNFIEYELGLGLYSERWVSHLYFDRYQAKQVVYYKKDGVKYGNEAIVKINNLSVNPYRLLIVPNPAIDNIRIEGEYGYGSLVYIKDLKGRQVIKSLNFKKDQVLDVSALEQGVYLVVVVDSDKQYSGKLVIL